MKLDKQADEGFIFRTHYVTLDASDKVAVVVNVNGESRLIRCQEVPVGSGYWEVYVPVNRGMYSCMLIKPKQIYSSLKI